jgi:hypothetical protein
MSAPRTPCFLSKPLKDAVEYVLKARTAESFLRDMAAHGNQFAERLPVEWKARVLEHGARLARTEADAAALVVEVKELPEATP